MAWSFIDDGSGGGYYYDSDTGAVSTDPSVMQTANTSITPGNVAAAYQQLTGQAPTQDWINQTVNAYQGDPNATVANVLRDTATAASASGTPFSNVAGDPNSFSAGAQYYQSQGYVPGGTTYEGVPTSFIDPSTGKVVASYGVTQQDQGGTPTSYASNQFQWNPTSSLPQGYTTALAIPQTDYNTGLLDALKGVGFVASALGGAAGLDALTAPTMVDALGMTPGAFDTSALAGGTTADIGTTSANGIYNQLVSNLTNNPGYDISQGTQVASNALPGETSSVTFPDQTVPVDTSNMKITLYGTMDGAVPTAVGGAAGTGAGVGSLAGSTTAGAGSLAGSTTAGAGSLAGAAAGSAAATAASLGMSTADAVANGLMDSAGNLTETGANQLMGPYNSPIDVPAPTETPVIPSEPVPTAPTPTEPTPTEPTPTEPTPTEPAPPTTPTDTTTPPTDTTTPSTPKIPSIPKVPTSTSTTTPAASTTAAASPSTSNAPPAPVASTFGGDIVKQSQPWEFANPSQPSADSQPLTPSMLSNLFSQEVFNPVYAASGGQPGMLSEEHDEPTYEHEPEFYSTGGLKHLYAKGGGDGTSDSVPAMLATGEFVLPAQIVSDIGNGDNEAGSKVLDKFLEVIRQHKRSNPVDELPPDSLGPLEYLKMAYKKANI